MARPKIVKGVPTAKESIEESFWKLFKERPIEKIKVTEVCKEAGVNKTTFYYHFQDIRAVLDSIEEDSLPLEAPDMIADLIRSDNHEKVIEDFLKDMGPRFERYCFLLSSKGDPEFSKKANERMTQRWCEKLGIDYKCLSPELRMSVRFTMGGAASIFAEHGDGADFDPKSFSSVIIAMALPLLERVLREQREYRKRKIAFG